MVIWLLFEKNFANLFTTIRSCVMILHVNFIGRREVRKELNECFCSGQFEMGTVYDSRRIGKAFLMKNSFI